MGGERKEGVLVSELRKEGRKERLLVIGKENNELGKERRNE